jgi:secondary thiamine-phosphate synthase enzyme
VTVALPNSDPSPRVHAPGQTYVACTDRLILKTHEAIEFTDITDEVISRLRASGVRDGFATIFSRHTTASIRLQENEPLLLQDLRDFLERSAPPHAHYRHNDFRVRTVHMHEDERPNGHAHCLQMMLGSSERIPIVGGELQLGQWQRVFLIELDGPRASREIIIHLLGTPDEAL